MSEKKMNLFRENEIGIG